MAFSPAHFVRTFKKVDTLNELFVRESIDMQLSNKNSKDERVEIFLGQLKKLDTETSQKLKGILKKVHDCSNRELFNQLLAEIHESKNSESISQDFLDSAPALKEKFLHLYIHHPRYFTKIELDKAIIKSQGWKSFFPPNSNLIDIEEIRKQLSDKLSKLIFETQQRGRRCYVEHIPEDDFVAFVAYPEDYPTTVIEYDSSEGLNKGKTRNPIFTIYLLYSPKLNMIRVKAGGGKTQVMRYAQIFVETAFGISDWSAEENHIKASIEKIFEPDFQFKLSDIFEGIYMNSVTLDFGDSETIHKVKGRTKKERKLFIESLKLRTNRAILDQAKVIKKVSLSAKLRDSGLTKGKLITFDIDNQGGTTLHNEVEGTEILQVLIDSGIIHG